MAEFSLGFGNEGVVKDISNARKEPAWLLADRLRALDRFSSLPIENEQLFIKYTDMSRANVGESTPYVEPASSTGAAKPDSPEVAGIFHQTDNFVEALGLKAELKEKGVVFEPLGDAVLRHPELPRRIIFDHTTLPEHDKFAQMSKALWTSGLLLQIPDDVVIRDPLIIRWSCNKGGAALLSRTVISMGRNSSATIIEELESANKVSSGPRRLFGGTSEILLGEDAVLKYNCIENLDGGSVAFINRHATLGTNSEIDWGLGHVGGDMIRSRVDNLLGGRGSTVREVQALYGNKSQFFDLFSHTRHIAEDTVSDLLSKGILQDQSKAYAKGLITIERGGKGSDSYLGEFGMVMSRESRYLAIPSLEIENHAIKRAKHSSSVAQVDERQIFYLSSRGIEESEARKLIVMGFLEPVVEKIPLESVATQLRNLFESKWVV